MVRAMQRLRPVIDRVSAARRAAEHIRAWNANRPDAFRDMGIQAIAEAREAFRPGVEGEVPRRGEDPLYDALEDLGRNLDSSPEGVDRACSHVLELASPTPSAHQTQAPERRVAQDRPSEDLADADVPAIEVVGGMRGIAGDAHRRPGDRAHPLDEEA
jgi:hypothetical protein